MYFYIFRNEYWEFIGFKSGNINITQMLTYAIKTTSKIIHIILEHICHSLFAVFSIYCVIQRMIKKY